MLSKFDDFCIHQTSDPIATASQSDRNFYDRYWFSGFDKSGGFCFEAGFGVYPNRFVMDAHFSVVINGRQTTFHSSRRAPQDRSDTRVGPLLIEVIEPMKVIRILLQKNDTGISCDLTFSAITGATLEPKNVMTEGVHTIMNTSRFTQFGYWSGFIEIDDSRIDVVGEQTLGIRDKSWGVRPVGEPQGGAPGLLNAEPGVYWCWNPINFGDFCTQFGTFEDHDGNATQLSACKVPTYKELADVPIGEEPNHIEMNDANLSITWRQGTRHAANAQLTLSYGENTMVIDEQPVQQFYMLGIGYQHPEWGHAVWKGDLITDREDWLLADLDPLDYKHIHQHQIVKATCGELTGVGLLETVVFGRHDPSGFKEILDGAA